MKIIFVSFAVFAMITAAVAQKEALPIFTAATDRSVYILLVNIPEGTEAFRVYRRDPGDREYYLRTPVPIAAVIDPAVAHQILGDDYPYVARALRAEDAFDVLRRLQADRGMAAVLSFSNLNVARVAGRLFVDEQVEKNATYAYRMEFLDYAGEVIGSTERDIAVRDFLPDAPEEVVCDAGDRQVRISWDYPAYSGQPDDIVIGFNIYRKAARGQFEKINRMPILRQENLKYRMDVGVENGEAYTYYVTAVDFTGRESRPSSQSTTTPEDVTPPLFPQGLDAHDEEGGILVTWDMNLELDLSHYDLYKSYDMDVDFSKLNTEPIPGDEPYYRDGEVRSGQQYYYKLKAVDFDGNESDFSNVISGHPADSTAPAAPDSVLARVIGHDVRLTWLAPADEDLLGYYVYRRRSDLEFMRLVGPPVPKDTTEFSDTGYQDQGLWPGQTFYYGVSAVDRVYNESPAVEVQVIIPDDEPPLAPLDSYASSTPEGLVRVTWQPSMSLDVAGYRIYRGEESAMPAAVLETDDSTFVAVDSTALAGVVYRYHVVAFDRSGNESEKTEQTAVIPRDLTAPPSPANITATADSAGVVVLWDAVRAHDLVGYHIYRSEIPTGTAVRVNTEPVTTTFFRDPNGRAELYYRVSSLDTSGHENAEGQAVEAVRTQPTGSR